MMVKKRNLFQIPGMEFPAGRKTRVMIGENGVVRGEHFCQGYVVIYPNGSIPVHHHETVESYTVLKGRGQLDVNGSTQEMEAGDFVFLPGGVPHGLKNTGDEDLHLMFVYAPQLVVDHWAQELSGELK